MRIVFLTLAILTTIPAFAEVRVWAVSDGVRVDPVTGRVLESQPAIHADYPAGDFRRGNLVWNGETQTVSLKSARNEFTAFQAIVESERSARRHGQRRHRRFEAGGRSGDFRP